MKEDKIDSLKKSLQKKDWTAMNKFNSNEAIDYLHKTVLSELYSICPIKTIKISGKNRIREPWMNKGLVKSGTRLSKMYREIIINKANPNNYKTQRSLHNRLKRHAQRDFFTKKFLEFKGQSRKVWNLINTITGKMANKSSLIDLIKIEGKELDCPKEISETFADFFTNIGTQTVNKIKLCNNFRPKYERPHEKEYLSKTCK